MWREREGVDWKETNPSPVMEASAISGRRLSSFPPSQVHSSVLEVDTGGL